MLHHAVTGRYAKSSPKWMFGANPAATRFGVKWVEASVYAKTDLQEIGKGARTPVHDASSGSAT